MCGFIGTISYKKINDSAIRSANKFIECRGPDSNIFTNKNINDLNLSLIFNRLSILDLSKNANQPMHSKEFNTTLMFNGEIYNNLELRNELIKNKVHFSTSHSDSETVLNGLSFYGLDFLKKLRGQFSIFFLDENKRKAYLIRDRLGQKPLYFHKDKDTLIFGSSLLSLLKIKKDFKVSEKSVYNYLNYGIIHSPYTLFENFYKVCPSEIIEINFQKQNLQTQKYFYWNPEEYIDNREFDTDEFFNLFSESINIRTIADVPVANFLSGGIDSTSITKNLYDNNLDINSFSIYLDNPKYDESKFIKSVVNKYNLKHNAVSISSKIENSNIYESLTSLDEPYSDPSVVPSFLLSKEISNSYKVAISGDGGDELLGGYKRTLRTLTKRGNVEDLFSKLYNIYPAIFGTGNKILSKSKNIEKNYRSFLEDEKLLDLLKVKSEKYDFANNLNENSGNLYKNLLIADYRFYLPEMMMFKVDRTSMANSLEVRSPFVDHKLIEYILSTNNAYFDKKSSKKILKNYLKEDFNEEFINREKQGFIFDVEAWVYKNKDEINNLIKNGSIINNLNVNIVNLLSIYKSRINGIRIWKLFVLEEYISRVNSL